MMKFGQIWRRKPRSTDSHFVSPLDRVRDMRDHGGWQPLTAPCSIQQRADRVAEAREHVVLPPLGSEHETRPLEQPSRVDWWDLLWAALVGIAGFFAIVLVWLIFISED